MKGEKSMSNPNFVPNWSTNDIYRDGDTNRCLTDDLDAIELGLAGKAEAGHTHTEYASSAHTHSEYAPSTHEHTGYAPASHEHTGYAPSTHEHEEYAAANHEHAGYASSNHTHTEYAPSEHTHAGYATSNHAHTEYAPASHSHTGYAPSNHTHTANAVGAIAKSLQFTNDNGGVEFSFGTNSGKNILTEINSWGVGFHTAYAISGTDGNPNETDSFRYLVHKTSANIGWVLAFGGQGDVYVNYDHDGTYRGWRNLYTTSNPPTAAEVGAIDKSLQFTADNGDVKENLSAVDVLATIAAKPAGVYTFYAGVGATNNPLSTSAWRYIVHKTNVNYGWLLAFGSEGSVFGNYLHEGNWKGWTAIYNATANTLWTGAKYMNAAHTATPSKKLSECRNGWMLEWSDYDADTDTANNYNIVHTPIYKRNVAGNWSGQNMMVLVPNYVSTDGATSTFCIKQLLVHDDKIVGHALNSTGANSIDVVLRAIYEF